MGFPLNFEKMQQNLSYGYNLANWYSYYSHSMDDFSPLDSHAMVYSIIWEMHGISLQFPRAWKKEAKTINWEKPWEINSRTSPIVWVLFSY